MYNAGSALGLSDDAPRRAGLDDVLLGVSAIAVRDVVVEDFSVLRFAGPGD